MARAYADYTIGECGRVASTKVAMAEMHWLLDTKKV